MGQVERHCYWLSWDRWRGTVTGYRGTGGGALSLFIVGQMEDALTDYRGTGGGLQLLVIVG